MSNWKLPKWAVVIATALLFVPLAVDWVAPGEGTRLACLVLRASCKTTNYNLPTTNYFPLWSWLVGLAGKDVAALGWISVGAGLVCVWLVAVIVGTLFGAAVRGAKTGGAKEEEGNYAGVESAAVLLAGLGFALTPGLLIAATRISPLMVVFLPPLAALALVVRVVFGLPIIACPLLTADRPTEVRDRVLADDIPIIDRLLMGKGCLFLALMLLAYSAYEVVLARRVVLSLTFPAVVVWLAVGVLPAILIAGCLRMRWTVGRKAIWSAFGGWALAVAVTATVAFTSGWLNEGRAANRIVAAILKNADEGGKVAIVSDGTMDQLYFFMLPEGVKLISLAREREPEYGRELSEWVQGEDLAFAAELGPRALLDEWTKTDRAGFEAAVATVANFFPTREKWDEACRELAGMRADDPMAKCLRHLLAVCGNAIGCARLGRTGDDGEAWAIFRAVVDRVEPKNYAAYLNLQGMVERGYAVSKDEVSELAKRRQQIEKDLKGWEQIVRAARIGGQLYADPEAVAKFERERREAAAKREPSPEARAFVETVAAASKDPQSGKAAQAAIHKAIREGKVRSDVIGGRLIAIDLALGDLANAEKDAIDVLKLARHDPAANAALGSLAAMRGDFGRAERYLRRSLATGGASVAATNDLAWTLYRLGRLDEAEAFARRAVDGSGEMWTHRETLAAILIRRERLDEGARELAKAEELAERAGLAKGTVASIEIDRARLHKARGDMSRFKMVMRYLRNRKDLTDEQKAEVGGMDW